MPYYHFQWTPEIVEHLEEHDVSPEDFELVVTQPERTGKSRSSKAPVAFGHTADGRYIIAVYRIIDDITIEPVTAYEISE